MAEREKSKVAQEEKKRKPSRKKEKITYTTGKRKSAVARAIAKQGTGIILINNKPIEQAEPEQARLMLMEPLILAGESAKGINIIVSVSGGGVMGQAEAARQAIAKAFVAGNKELKQTFLEYDRSLLIADPRRNEPHKPSRSKAGPRRHKQRSKR